MTLDQLLAAAVGPAGSVVVLLIILYGGSKFFSGRLLPVAEKAIDRHLAQVDSLIAQNAALIAAHERDRDAFVNALEGHRREVVDALARIERAVGKGPGATP